MPGRAVDRASRRFTWLYAKSQIALKYRYTALGVLWNVLEPALYLGTLSLVFSVVNRMRLGDYAVFLFSALVPWRYFEKVVTTCMDSIVQGDWLIKKLPVSPFALPLTRWLVATVEFGFSFAVVFGVFALVKDRWTIHCLVIPLAVLAWSALGLGLGLAAAALFTFFRDVKPLIQTALLLAFFSAPILFKPEVFSSSNAGALVRLHPITYFAALLQKPIYSMVWPDRWDWGVSIACALVSLAIGIASLRASRARLYYYV